MDLTQVHDWIIILKPIGGLILGIVGGLAVLLIWSILKPWLEQQKKQTKKEKKRIEKLKQDLKRDRSDEIRKKALAEFCKLVAVDVIKIVSVLVVTGLIILLFLQSYKDFDDSIWESRNEIVQSIDETKNLLYLRTKREPIDPVCVGEKKPNTDVSNKCIRDLKREKAILKRQSLCRLKALLESNKYTTHEITKIGNTVLSYQVCMLEEGWSTEPCPKGEKDCVELWHVESTCISLMREWLKTRGSDRAFEMCEEL